MGMTNRRVGFGVALLVVILSACGGSPDDSDDSRPTDTSPTETTPPGTATVAEDREAACEELLLAVGAASLEVTIPREVEGLPLLVYDQPPVRPL